MSMIMTNNDNFDTEVYSDDTLKVLIFGASWCGHCKAMRPMVAEYAQEHPEIKICGSDADEADQIVAKFGISSIPCTIIVKNKEEQERKVGGMTKEELTALVNKYL